jgi:branched-chain amino acid transport system ATP-binding protein
MVEIDNLTVQFGGVKPLDSLSVVLRAPVVGLIGPNGAGKTTLLNAFSGFVRPAQGEIRINGTSIRGVPAHRRATQHGIRRTFQTDQIADDLTLRQNVLAVADHARYPRALAAAAAVDKALDFVGLSTRMHRRGDELTIEERHLTEIAKTLLGEPQLILLDEPGAGLSEVESAHLLEVIRGIEAYCGAQVILVDHDVELISDSCQETAVLDFGRLLAIGPTRAVLAQPEVRRAYLGEAEGAAA